jgi:hypothetical protein
MSNSLPKFFCVESMSKYRVYLNTLYRDLNILWPQENIVAGEMSIKLRTDIEKTVSYRKWNGRECKPLSWSFTGSSINMRLNDRHISIVCPIISVSDPGILPYNSCSIKPSSMIFTDILDTSNYETAVLYERDPNSAEYIVPRAMFTSVAVAVPVPVSVPVLVPVPVPVFVLVLVYQEEHRHYPHDTPQTNDPSVTILYSQRQME